MILPHNKRKVVIMGGAAMTMMAVLAVILSPAPIATENTALMYFCALLFVLVIFSFFAFKRDFANLTSWWGFVIVLQFGVAPLLCYVLGIGDIDFFSVMALQYVAIGTGAFWLGARFVARVQKERTFIYVPSVTVNRRIYLALVIVAIGCAAKLYMVRSGLFSYVSDINQVEAASQYREYLTIASGFTLVAQVIVSIEFFSQQRTMLLKYAFPAITATNLLFSLLSGMKSELLIIPFLILLVRKLVTGKLGWQMVTGLTLLLLLVFPLNSSYRSEVQSEGSITSLEVGKDAIGRAAQAESEGTTSEYFLKAFGSVADRLNLLPSVVFLDQDRQTGNSIQGDERIWMIPFYPFVPRFIWKNKPVLDKGRRLSIAMGVGEFTSTAVTPFGDLLVTGGILALIVGMMCVGATIQAITNLIAKEYGPKALFIYCVLFSKFYLPENDVVIMGTTLIQVTCVALIAAYVFYGGRLFQVAPSQLRFVKSRGGALVAQRLGHFRG